MPEETRKLLIHPLRERMVALVMDRPLTAKEVALELGATVGNAHYHLQRLVAGGVLDSDDIPNATGGVDKRYRLAAAQAPAALHPPQADLLDMSMDLWLSVAETGQLVNEIKALLYRWQSSHGEMRGRLQAVSVNVGLSRKPTS